MNRALDDPWATANSLDALGALFCDRGDLAGAAERYLTSLPYRREVGGNAGFATWLADVATLAVAGGQAATAARLLTTADEIREVPLARVSPPWRGRYGSATAAARAALGDAAFGEAQAAGQSLSPDEAIAEAMALLATVCDSPPLVPRA